jgi:hypothetical protein
MFRGSIPRGVTGFFSDIFLPTVPWPWDRLSLLVKMSTRIIFWGKGGGCVRLTNSPPSRVKCHEIWERDTHETLWATPGLLRDSYSDIVTSEDSDLLVNIPKHFCCLYLYDIT